jgi:hypothetical protein
MPQVFPEIQLVLWYENSVKVETKNSLIEYGTNGVIGRSRTNLVNDVRKTFSLQGVLRDRNEINDFLLSNRGKPFVFRPYNDDYCGLFVCSSWSWRWTALNVWEFSATFSEVFRPGWIPTAIPYRLSIGSESSVDAIFPEIVFYSLFGGSSSNAVLQITDLYGLYFGSESSGSLQLGVGFSDPYQLFSGFDASASLQIGDLISTPYSLNSGNDSGSSLYITEIYVTTSGTESSAILSLGLGISESLLLNSGNETNVNIEIGDLISVPYTLNSGSDNGTILVYVESYVLNSGNEYSVNLELGPGFVESYLLTSGIESNTNLQLGDPVSIPYNLNSGTDSGSNFVMTQTDPYYGNVSLLLLGNGTNNSTNFVDSGPANRTVTVSSGTPIITTSQSKYGNGSITGGKIEVPYNSAFDWGTGDFTIEFWFRYSGTLADAFRFTEVKVSPGFAFGGRVVSGIRYISILQEGIVWESEFPWTPPNPNTWAHIALTRSGSTVRIFQDGVSLGTRTNTRNWSMNNSAFIISPSSTPSSVGIASGGAWFDDFRVTKGVARYTTDFTPPTQELEVPRNSDPYSLSVGVESNASFNDPYSLNAGIESSAGLNDPYSLNAGIESGSELTLSSVTTSDPYYNNVSLLLLSNGTDNSTNFIDSGPANRTVTVFSGTPVITTSQFRYGNGSITGGKIQTPYNSAFDWGTGDFTVEFWFRYSGTLANEVRFCSGTTIIGSGASPCFAFGSRLFGGSRYIGVLQENVVWDVEFNWTPVGVNTWAHIALTRQGTTMRIFQNGISLGSATNSRNWNINNNPFFVMPDIVNTASGGAWFDDFRVTKGIARYTGTFTPPTTEAPVQ